jgi:spore coat protein U-like protein
MSMQFARIVLLLILLGPAALLHAATCNLSMTGLSFGSVEILNGNYRDSSGSVVVTCSGNTGEIVNYSISAMLPPAYSGVRALQEGGRLLKYNLFTDVSRSLPLGDGTRGTTVISGSMTLPGSQMQQIHVVYARVYGHQNAASPGTYNDEIVLTISY